MVLEGQYDAIGQTIRASAVLHADETGWRINGVTCWLWAFATRQYCYYLIDPRRGAAVVKQVLGTLCGGILITDFWGAYNAIEALAKKPGLAQAEVATSNLSTRSRNSLPGLKWGTNFAGTRILLPDFRFRPLRGKSIRPCPRAAPSQWSFVMFGSPGRARTMQLMSCCGPC